MDTAARISRSEADTGRRSVETIPVEGVFNAASAVDLEVAMERAALRTGELIVDFSRVRELRGLGLAVLGHVLARLEAGGPRVTLEGLCEAEMRVARRWGVEARAL